MTSFYRFRPIKRLLGDSRELETQTIYFASPEELNDPMEGRVDLVFRGDTIVWENLFRHFSGCLAWAVIRHVLVGEDKPLTVGDLPLRDPFDSSVTAVVRLVQSLSDRLVNDEDVRSLVRRLSTRTVGEAEVRLYLRRLHQPWAVEALRLLPRHPLGGAIPDIPKPNLSKLVDAIESVLSSDKRPGSEGALESMLQSAEVEAQKRNVQTWASLDGPLRPNHTFVHLAFVDHYLKGLRSLLYPQWYTACFMDDVSDASVWGHYANGHRDVCLKFRATTNGERETLPLRAPVGWSSGTGVTWNVTPLPFKQVSYTPDVIQLNFFTAMGNLPVPTLNKVWRVSRDGVLSPIEREVHGDEDAWREGYWHAFESSISTKLRHWSAEREHRITFHSNINDLSDPAMRLLTYDFDDLEGIVFGVKTSDAHKQALIRAIREKCASTGRDGFEFFQAIHRADGEGIEVVSLGMLGASAPEAHGAP